MMDWLVFNIPELVHRPVVGGGCCAVASTWLVEETIASLPGVSEVRADDQQGTVIVQIDTERIDGQAIWEELDALGFRPVQWERHDERAAIGNQGVRL